MPARCDRFIRMYEVYHAHGHKHSLTETGKSANFHRNVARNLGQESESRRRMVSAKCRASRVSGRFMSMPAISSIRFMR